MVFNWFRRQFSPESSEDDTPEVTESLPEEAKQPSEDPEDSPSSDDSKTSKPDYLGWAKAAFANIQQQQSIPTVEDAEEPEAIVEPDGGAEPSTEASTRIASPTLGEDSHEDTVSEISETSPAAEMLVQESTVESVEVSITESVQTPVSDATQAPASEPQASPAAAAEPTEAVDFDEGFIWSAEVLAAQGRRPEEISVEEITWLKKLRRGLGKTRQGLVNQLKSVVGQGPLNQDGVTEIETLLLQADVGVVATDRIIETLQNKLRQETLPPDQAIAYLKQILREMLEEPYQKNYASTFMPERGALNVWLMTGVNGAGKTTTIGKITHVAKNSGYHCLIAAADTFRAAAVEQVKVWGQRSGVDVIANPGQNTDPAAVVYDAIAAAQSRDIDLLLVDTAGRLQNKKNLMAELEKIRRIIDKKAPNSKVESLLVLDATLGQNGLRQAQVFSEAAQLTGVVLTKLDGTAKGGVALAVVQQLGLPIRFIGAGEGITDLRPFSSYEFIEALLSS